MEDGSVVVNFFRMPYGLAALILFAATVHGAPLYVDADAPGPADGMTWATAFTNPQDALAIAVSGDEIFVAQGTYMPNGARIGDNGFVAGNDAAVPFQLIDGVRLRGGYAGFGEADPDSRDPGANVTVLSGDLTGDDIPLACAVDRPDCNSHGQRCTEGFCIIKDNFINNVEHVVTGHGTDVSAELDGVTISGGNGGFGGGMYNVAGSPMVTNCTFSGNRVNVKGGGMFNDANSNPAVTNCTFNGNYADNGGGGMCNDISSSTVTNNCAISNCTFSGNAATFGGGMFNVGPLSRRTITNCTIANCTFSGNSTSSGGAGGGMNNSSFADPTLINCTFNGNWAGTGGGGGLGGGIANYNGSSPTLTNCAFSGNRTDRGGGIANYFASSTTITNCTFSGNTASQYGGGVYNERSTVTTLTNCTLSGNTANTDGGGIRNNNTPATLTNCILLGNSPNEINTVPNPNTKFSYNNIAGSGGSVAWDSSLGVDDGGNIDADPLLADSLGPDGLAGTADDDLHLLPGSPSIDAANYDAYVLVGGGPVDLDNAARVIDDANTVDTGLGILTYLDMGAFEAVGCNDNGAPGDCVKDCAGVLGGLALVDDCGVCAGGTTGLSPDADQDCNGVCFGSALLDDCGVCSAGDTGHEPNSDKDCNGVCFETAQPDDCGVCAGGSTGLEPNADKDCNGDCFGSAFIDDCEICAGGNTGVEPNTTGDCGNAVLMDIKPGSCPNAFNRGSRGVLPLAILSTTAFDVIAIDLSSLTLSRADGQGAQLMLWSDGTLIGSVFADVATPSAGGSCNCHTADRDGMTDLLFHVSSSAISDALSLDSLEIGANVELRVQGLLLDGSAFQAVDCIWLTNGKNHRKQR